MAELDIVPIKAGDMTEDQYGNLGRLREELENAQFSGDLFAEWHAATRIASYLWNVSASFDVIYLSELADERAHANGQV